MPSGRPTADPSDRIAAAVPALMAYACALTRSRDEAEDLVQETCLAALAGWAGYDAARDLGGWLRGIMRNKHVDAVRRRRALPLDPDVLDAIDAWHERAPAEILEALDRCLSRLPDELRSILERHHQDGIGIAALAAGGGISVDGIKKRLVRARTLLLACLASRGFRGTGDPAATNIPAKAPP